MPRDREVTGVAGDTFSHRAPNFSLQSCSEKAWPACATRPGGILSQGPVTLKGGDLTKGQDVLNSRCDISGPTCPRGAWIRF